MESRMVTFGFRNGLVICLKSDEMHIQLEQIRLEVIKGTFKIDTFVDVDFIGEVNPPGPE